MDGRKLRSPLEFQGLLRTSTGIDPLADAIASGAARRLFPLVKRVDLRHKGEDIPEVTGQGFAAWRTIWRRIKFNKTT